MSDVAEKKQKIEQPLRVRCPKHMKMPKSVKTFGALGPWKTKEERNHYQRSMAIAIYEAEHRVKKIPAMGKTSLRASTDDAAE